jgi:hypothetical protein
MVSVMAHVTPTNVVTMVEIALLQIQPRVPTENDEIVEVAYMCTPNDAISAPKFNAS